jgi:hypothetical protein
VGEPRPKRQSQNHSSSERRALKAKTLALGLLRNSQSIDPRKPANRSRRVFLFKPWR